MTTIAQLITQGYRESNLIANGATESPAEQAEGLLLLENYILSLFGNEAGDPLVPMLYGVNSNVDRGTYNNDFETFVNDWYVPPGYQLKLNLPESRTIRLKPNPEDGATFGVVDASNNLATNNLTIMGNGSRIEGNTSLTLNTDGQSSVWFYRADTANWARITDLTVTDESPFPKEFDNLLSIGLAMRLDPRNGNGLSQLSVNRYSEVMSKFKSRYNQTREMALDWALSRMDGDRFFRRRYTIEGEFERGSIYRW
jgi:hypothetical protein